MSISNTADLEHSLKESTHMWNMVVISQIVVYDAMIDVIRLDEVLESSRSLVRILFDVVDCNRLQIDLRASCCAATQEARPSNTQGPDGEHGESRPREIHSSNYWIGPCGYMTARFCARALLCPERSRDDVGAKVRFALDVACESSI